MNFLARSKLMTHNLFLYISQNRKEKHWAHFHQLIRSKQPIGVGKFHEMTIFYVQTISTVALNCLCLFPTYPVCLLLSFDYCYYSSTKHFYYALRQKKKNWNVRALKHLNPSNTTNSRIRNTFKPTITEHFIPLRKCDLHS